MKKYKNIIILLNLVVLLSLFTKTLLHKEQTLENGKLVLLELAPVDPRSLMQGDYMRLRYDITGSVDDETSKRGYCIVKLDSTDVVEIVRFQDNVNPKSDNEYSIKYSKVKYGRVNIGAESFFFQEGEGEKYEKAKYGGLMIDNNGKSILVGLYDENRKKI